MKTTLKPKQALTLIIPLLITLSLTFFLQRTVVNNPEVIQKLLESFGVYTIFAYIIIQSITIIIAPLGGLAAAIAILAIFGPMWGVIIIYLVTTPLYIINFLIAKKYGRKIVRKIVGISGMKLIDKYTQKITVDVLILLKIFLGGYSDFIAYAAGFTKTKLKTFILISYLGAIPGSILQFLIFKLSPSFTVAVSLLIIIPAILGVLYLPFHNQTKKYLRNKNLVPPEL